MLSGFFYYNFDTQNQTVFINQAKKAQKGANLMLKCKIFIKTCKFVLTSGNSCDRIIICRQTEVNQGGHLSIIKSIAESKE